MGLGRAGGSELGLAVSGKCVCVAGGGGVLWMTKGLCKKQPLRVT